MTFRSASLLLLLSALFCAATQAQSPKTLLVDPVASKVSLPEAGTPIVRNDPPKAELPRESSENEASVTDAAAPAANQFRLERTPLVGGAELLTIFGRLDGLAVRGRGQANRNQESEGKSFDPTCHFVMCLTISAGFNIHSSPLAMFLSFTLLLLISSSPRTQTNGTFIASAYLNCLPSLSASG